jgi:hypothetical protein
MDIWFPLIGDWIWSFDEVDFANGGAVWIMVNWHDSVYNDCLETYFFVRYDKHACIW